MATIHLRDETAAALSKQAGIFGLDLPQYLERLARQSVVDVASRDPIAAASRWDQLVKSMPGSVSGVDDSRESIYGDRD